MLNVKEGREVLCQESFSQGVIFVVDLNQESGIGMGWR